MTTHAQTDARGLSRSSDRGETLLRALEGFDDEFVALLEAGQQEQEPMQDHGPTPTELAPPR